MSKKQFRKTVYSHYKRHGRKLPWRLRSTTPYHIMIAEIMLQQTQVDRVIPYYKNFLKKFPTPKKLANASLKNTLTVWQGLGYNRRALQLKHTAKIIVEKHRGKIPKTIKELTNLPGIGEYTARAILTFAYNQPHIVIETNIRSVYIHHFFKNKKNITDNKIFPLIEKTLDRKNPREWYAALMDYGSMLKNTLENPSRKSAHHIKQPEFKNSDRQIRGEIIRALTKESMSEIKLSYTIKRPASRIIPLLKILQKEGLIKKARKNYSLS